MRPFEYVRATDPLQAVATVTADPAAEFLAGGTTELDLMLRDGVIAPERLVDISRLPLKGTIPGDTGVRVGATTTMEELAADPTVAQRLPLVREALLAGASVQLRNMATIGGNLLRGPAAGTSATPPCPTATSAGRAAAAPRWSVRRGCTPSWVPPSTASRSTPPTWRSPWWPSTPGCTARS
jgi:CO/xanthine dehydrogenase FAD-binding subunit